MFGLGREVGKFLYLGQVAWPRKALCAVTGHSIFEHCGQNDRFPFFGPICWPGRLPYITSVPFEMWLSACARTMGGQGCGEVAHWCHSTDRRAPGRSHSDVGANNGTPPASRPPSTTKDRGCDMGSGCGTSASPRRRGAWEKVAAGEGGPVQRLNEPGMHLEANLADRSLARGPLSLQPTVDVPNLLRPTSVACSRA